MNETECYFGLAQFYGMETDGRNSVGIGEGNNTLRIYYKANLGESEPGQVGVCTYGIGKIFDEEGLWAMDAEVVESCP